MMSELYRSYVGIMSELCRNDDGTCIKSINIALIYFIIPRTRTTKYHESFIPKSSREWNSMPDEIKSCECLATFKRLVKKKLFPTKTQYLSNGKGKHSINHARMRMGLSHLMPRSHIHRAPHDCSCPVLPGGLPWILETVGLPCEFNFCGVCGQIFYDVRAVPFKNLIVRRVRKIGRRSPGGNHAGSPRLTGASCGCRAVECVQLHLCTTKTIRWDTTYR